MTIETLLDRAYAAWRTGGEAGLTALAAEAKDIDRARMTARAEELEAVQDRCVISKVKATLLREIIAAPH